MRALLIFTKAGKAAKVESGSRPALLKKLRGLTTLPEGVDEVQLWTRHGGLQAKASKAKLEAKAKAKAPPKPKATKKKAKAE